MNTKLSTRKGFTLIEIVLALAILAIIVVVFYGLFANSLIWVLRAGDKGIAYHIAQEDIEKRIALREADVKSDLNITFFGKTFPIVGGLIESEKDEGMSNSRLEAFVPFVPTLTFELPTIREASNSGDIELDIYGDNTNFGTSIVELYDRNGKIGNLTVTGIIDKENMSVVIPSYMSDSKFKLTNSMNNYVIRVVSSVPAGTEYARGKFIIGLPTAIAIGDDVFYSSADGLNWMNRRNLSDHSDFIGLNLLDAAAGLTKFVAVGDSGVVFSSEDNNNWIRYNIASNSRLNTIHRSESLGLYFTSGSSGRIYFSNNPERADDWHDTNKTNSKEIKSITSSFEKIVIAVGVDGYVFISSKPFEPMMDSWYVEQLVADEVTIVSDEGVDEEIELYLDINDIVHGNGQFVAVGDGGYVYHSTNGITWDTIGSISDEDTDSVESPDDPLTPNNYDLLSICYYENVNSFIAVGQNGQVFTSSNGESWARNESVSITNDLNGINAVDEDNDGIDDRVVVVGDGIVLTSTNLIDWVTVNGVSGYFNALIAR